MSNLEMDWIVARDHERQREIDQHRSAVQWFIARDNRWREDERKHPTPNIFASAFHSVGRVGADYRPCGVAARDE